MPETFISYRKNSKCGVLVNQLVQSLEKFKLDPFLDRQDIVIGTKYESRILKALADADIVVVLMDDTWLTVVDSEGNRRLDDPKDWVRREIELAQSLDKRIVPVLFDVSANFELAGDPVPAVRALDAFQCYRITREYSDRDIRDFCEAIKRGTRRRRAGSGFVISGNQLLAMAAVQFLAFLGFVAAVVAYPVLPEWLPAFPGTGSLSASLFWMCVRAGVFQSAAEGA